jgi:hypothetical protein
MSREKLSLVIYEHDRRPRFFELSKASYRTLLIGLPLVTMIALLALGSVLIYFREIRAVAMRKEPQIIQSLKDEKLRLQAREQELIFTNKELETKLATTDIDAEGLSATLGLFKLTPGMEDLSANPILGIEDVNVKSNEDKVILNFNLVNLLSETNRQVGYIFALIISGNKIHVYPEDAFNDSDPLISFNKGEYFATARFRPVEAAFNKSSIGNRGLVKVLLFSRTGDLLAKKTQNYQF